MKYCCLTDLQLVDDELFNDILVWANNPTGTLISEYTNQNINSWLGAGTRLSDVADQSQLLLVEERLNSRLAANPEYKLAYFRTWINDDITQRVLDRLPNNIKATNPSIRLQLIQNGLVPHIDLYRKTVLICPIVTNKEQTIFWDKNDAHTFGMGVLADPDQITQRMSVEFKPRESWLLDVSEVHSVELNNQLNQRITISVGWESLTFNEVVKLLHES